MPDPGFMQTIQSQIARPRQAEGETLSAGQKDLRDYAHKMALEAGIDPWRFMAQMKKEGEWHVDPDMAIFGRDAEELKRIGKTTIGTAQLDPQWHPAELKRLSDPQGKYQLTDSKGKPLWDADRPLDLRNPYEALEYAAKLMWAQMVVFRHEQGYEPDLTAFDWKHDPNRPRREGETRALHHSESLYNVGPNPTEQQRAEASDYSRTISLLSPELREKYYEAIRGPFNIDNLRFDTINEGNLSPTSIAGDYMPGGAWIVRTGDTLSGIADRTNTSIAEIMRVNNLTDDTIHLGKVLRLPATASTEEDRKKFIARGQPTW